jgi:hypothetical protein
MKSKLSQCISTLALASLILPAAPALAATAASPSPTPSASIKPTASTSSGQTADGGVNLSAADVAALSAMNPAAQASGKPSTTQASPSPKASGTTCTGNNAQSGDQKTQYCNAADGAEEGKDTNDILTKVWAGVAGVCTAACAASFTGVATTAGDTVCTGTNLGAAGTDAVMTKNYTSAVMNVFVNQAGIANAFNSITGKATSNASSGKSHASCMTAATSALQAVTKGLAANDAAKAADTNLAMANELPSVNLPTVAPATAGEAVAPGGTSPAGNNANLAAGTPDASAAAGANTNHQALNDAGGVSAQNGSGCRDAKASGSSDRMIQCALAKDPTLPSFVSTPQFADELKKVSGVDLGTLLNGKRVDGGAAVTGLSAGVLGSEKTQELGKVLAEYASDLSTLSTYAGGGRGGAGGGGGNGEFDVNGAVQGLLSQLNGGGDEGGRGGPRNRDLRLGGGAGRAPAQVFSASKDGDENNRKFSIFERIAKRYFVISPRLKE